MERGNGPDTRAPVEQGRSTRIELQDSSEEDWPVSSSDQVSVETLESDSETVLMATNGPWENQEGRRQLDEEFAHRVRKWEGNDLEHCKTPQGESPGHGDKEQR